jgi:poly(A) polymerase
MTMPKIYKVGGCVRDKLLGIESNDIDFTFVLDDINMTVNDGFKEMEQYMLDRGYKIFLSTPDCFTIRAMFPDDHVNAGLVADFVLARKEVGYIEGTRRPKLELGTLYDDLQRRDFTVNAIAEDEDGNLIDPFNGKRDLLDFGLLRTPMNANITFMDDPLRILRALRFAVTKGFFIDTPLWHAMEQNDILEKLYNTVSQERIRDEIYKMMKYDSIHGMIILLEANDRIKEVVIDDNDISFIEIVFNNGLWLKPTFEKK